MPRASALFQVAVAPFPATFSAFRIWRRATDTRFSSQHQRQPYNYLLSFSDTCHEQQLYMAAIWRAPARIWPIITVWWLEGWLAGSQFCRHLVIFIVSNLQPPPSLFSPNHCRWWRHILIFSRPQANAYFRFSVAVCTRKSIKCNEQVFLKSVSFIYSFFIHVKRKETGNAVSEPKLGTLHRNLILLHFSHLIMRLVLSVVVWALLNNVCIVVFISKLRKTIYYSPNPPTYYYSQWHKHWWLTNMKLFAVKNAFVCIQFPADEKTHTQNLTRTMTRWEMGVL